MYAPRNTPKPIVDALVDALQKALKDRLWSTVSPNSA
jgi:tripartite-type tricarboxylate transporter receptor subunit TctC